MNTSILRLTAILSLFLIAKLGFGQCDVVIEIDGEEQTTIEVCSGETVTLDRVVSDECDNCYNPGNSTSTWTWNDGNDSDTGSNVDITVTETTQVVIEIVTNCNQNIAPPITASITIVVIEAPDFNIILGENSEPLCEGNDIELIIEGTFPNEITDYDWSGIIGNNGTAEEDNVQNDLDVSCEITDEFGCTYEQSVFLEVNEALINLSQSEDSYCEGDEFTVSATPNGTAPFTSCTWEVLDTSFQPDPTECSVTVDADISEHNGTWQVMVVDENGCEGMNTIEVDISPIPNVTFTLAESEVCNGAEDVQMAVSPSGGDFDNIIGMGCDEFDDNPFDLVNTEFDPTESGLGTFCLIYTVEENGCVGQAEATITVFDGPQVSFTSDLPSTCVQGPSIDLGDFVSPSPETPDGGIFVTNDCYEGQELDPNDPCLGPGIHVVEYTFTDEFGCTSSEESFIQIFEELTVSTSSDSEVCTGASADLESSPSGGQAGTYNYEWSPSAGLDDATSQNPTLMEAAATQTYTLSISDQNGCQATSQTTINVYEQPEVISFTQDPTNFCVGGDVELILVNNWSENDWNLDVDYAWLFDGNNVQTSSPENTFENIQDTTIVTILVEFDADGYNAGCESISTNFTLNPVPDPAPQLSSSQSSICSEEQIIFSATDVTPGTDFDWTFSPEPSELEIIGNGNVAVASWSNNAGDVDVTLVESLVDCEGTDALTVNINNDLAPQSAPIEQLGSTILVYSDAGPDCYQWGYIDEDGELNVLLNEITDQPETNQSIVLDEINSSFIYYCEVWFGDCGAPGCSTTSFYDDAFVNVTEFHSDNLYRVYPNPSEGQFWLELNDNFDANQRFSVIDVLGRNVESGTLNCSGDRCFIDLSHLPADLYLLSLENKGMTRIIVNR